MTGSHAWPFLVARGRERGYRTLLAPDFLLAARDHGVLDDSVVPDAASDRPSVAEIVTMAGQALTVVHATHTVTAADVAEPGAKPRAPRDRHGRPLRLIYGFVCVDRPAGEPDPADLAFCRTAALDAYRRFLADEDGFEVTPGRAFTPRTVLGPRTGRTRHGGATGGGTATRDDAERPRPFPTPVGMLIVAAILLAVSIAAVGWIASRGPEPATPCPTATSSARATSARSAGASTGPSPQPRRPPCPTAPPSGRHAG
ncbi:hypothetical protein GCM10023196_015680 [Actinoallomurus vinaceus]|uniref:Uncharacterized protein n=1 Tax=Actinoallomurus vinaceus TaxID=1080074 RepID=A0ABP8U2W2_9ACTN